MIKDLDKIHHQRNGFVRVGLLIEYLDQLAELKKLEMGTYEAGDGALVKRLESCWILYSIIIYPKAIW